VGLGGIALTHLLVRSGSAAIDLNLVNTVFLIAGLLLHRDLGAYVAAVTEGGKGVVGIVLQFPLYGGIHALMREAGLAAELSSAFVDASHWTAAALHVSPAVTFPVATLLSAGLLNLFIPSGGGQWIVQGPIMCAAASAIGMPIEQAVMAVSYGDEWTNMMQPFWAVPLMGLTGVDVRAFMGYCILIMLLATPVYVVGLLLF
jgi:short-chain fatty acids transporter